MHTIAAMESTEPEPEPSPRLDDAQLLAVVRAQLGDWAAELGAPMSLAYGGVSIPLARPRGRGINHILVREHRDALIIEFGKTFTDSKGRSRYAEIRGEVVDDCDLGATVSRICTEQVTR